LRTPPEVRPSKVGVGVVERGGLDLLETGDVALEMILDPGTDAERNFFEDSIRNFNAPGITAASSSSSSNRLKLTDSIRNMPTLTTTHPPLLICAYRNLRLVDRAM
jgi:hypothetical protein